MALVTCLMPGSLVYAALTLPNGIATGDIDQTSAILWARSTTVGPARFETSSQPDFALTTSVELEVVDSQVPVKAEISVRPGETVYYRFTDAVGDLAEGHFRVPEATGRHGLRFGVSGDWRGELRPYPSVSNMVDSDLDFFVTLGDTIYADIATPDVPTDQARTLDEFRRKHNEVYSERFGINTWAEIRSTTAIYACIDDHEVTNDFTGGAPPSSDPRFDDHGAMINETDLYRNGLRAFLDFNPIREEVYGDTGDPRTSGKPKLYRYRRFGDDAAIFIIDARSFRDDSPPLLNHPPNAWEYQAYLRNAYDPARTMLGEAQLELLRADLLAAQADGVTWKFIMIPEPTQNLGPIVGSDRFEGYAHERAELLQFINDRNIENVVFVAADIHGTIVNNVAFRQSPRGRLIATSAFEVTTGSVAFAPPLGAATLEYAPPLVQRWFAGRDALERDALALNLLNETLRIYGYPQVGLRGAPIDAQLLEGRYLAVNWFGWTMFEIDAQTQRLTVTTYGIPWYSPVEIAIRSDEILLRTPEIVSQFRVDPQSAPDPFAAGNDPPTGPGACGALGILALPLLCAWPALSARRLRYATAATQSISNLAPATTNSFTTIVDRAGGSFGKYSL